MGIERFEQLEVWREAHELVLGVFRLTPTFPADQKFGLVVQMQRAAVSVPANIAEGFKRRGPADKMRFYNISEGSLEELRYYLILCRDLGYKFEFDSIAAKADKIARMLNGLIKSIRR